ncbi:MAG: OmpA family protein [Bacteroidota bacterium]
MTRRLNFFCAIILVSLFSTMAFAQGQKTIYDDDVVQDPDGQHKEWKKGDHKYPSKPKDMWELGIHGGAFFIAGDVDPQFGWAAGLHLRKSLGYTFALRLNGMYGVARGLNASPSMVGAFRNTQLRNVGGTGYGRSGNSGSGLPWYHNFKNTYIEVAVQGVLTLNNLKFHKERNKWDLFLIGGLGANFYQTKYDALRDENGSTYAEFAQIAASGNADTRKGRKAIREDLRSVLDGDYETDGEKWQNLFNLTNDPNDPADGRMNVIANLGVGLGYHLSSRVTLTLEHQATFADDDLLDGYRWAEQGDFTRDVDVPQYTNLRINFHLGSFKNRVEPLWWLNPLDAPYEQIAKNTKKETGDRLDDDDGDGVPNKLDREPNTPADCPVDTKGVTLDSDSDGVPDCEDEEPYSPPGYPVDPNGVAQVPDDLEPRVIEIGDREGWSSGPVGCSDDWFLPMIHFDLDKFYLKPEFYPQLHQVATVMKNCPEINIVVKGHTDVRKPNAYNDVLSYKRANKAKDYLVSYYGIDASRLIVQYGGEEAPLIPGLADSHVGTNLEKEQAQYMNRRVEFIVATGDDSEMGQPAYDGDIEKVGKDTPRSSRGSKIYSGNGIY